jgi:hypothetical protein
MTNTPTSAEALPNLSLASADPGAAAELAGLAARIGAEHRASLEHLRMATLHVCRTGGLLLQAKARHEALRGYGSWESWVGAHCPFSVRTARQAMQLAAQFPDLADPDVHVDQVLAERPDLRALAEGSVARALKALPGRAGGVRGGSAGGHGASDQGSGYERPGGDPLEVLRIWVREQLPGASQDEREEVTLTYLGLRSESPPDADLFGMFCVGWNLGRRRPARSGKISRR